jgi:predicted RecA/RadA family phage recombinase
MVKYVHKGDRLDYTPTAKVSAGDVLVDGELVTVATHDIETGVKGSVARVGVFAFPKATGVGEGLDRGTIVYWDASGEVATDSDGSGANKRIGPVSTAAGDDDEVVHAVLGG